MDIVAILCASSIVSYTLCSGAPLAHAYEWANKMQLDADAYKTAQQLYRGWNKLALFDMIALLSVAFFAILTSNPLVWVALVCHIAAFAVFFIFTLPTNKRTRNWTVLPSDWHRLRRQWEYSHVVCAFLMITGITCLAITVARI